MKYGNVPPQAVAMSQLYNDGWIDLQFIRQTTTDAGPVLIFTGQYRTNLYVIHVGRWVGTDELDVRSRKLKSEERKANENPKAKNMDRLVTSLPRGIGKVYDPREEQIRAQRQGIYESSVRQALDVSGRTPFRDAKGVRLDVKHSTRMSRQMVGKMFAIGTGVQARDSRLYEGSQVVTLKTIRESAARYANVDHLIRNRQDYEETLALPRKSGFYRVVPEPTINGIRYFVWPLPPGERLPGPASTSLSEAEGFARKLNRQADPLETGVWWQPTSKVYTFKELSYWLPTKTVFSARWVPEILLNKTSVKVREK